MNTHNIKRREFLIHARTWVNLELYTKHKKQSEKTNLYNSIYMKCPDV